MVHRDVGGTPVEVVDRVAPLGHHPRDKPIRLADSALRIVDERGLHGSPRMRVATKLFCGQRHDVELLPLLLTGSKFFLRGDLITGFGDGSLVLRTESLLQVLASSSVAPGTNDDHCHDGGHHDRGNQNPTPNRHF
jgi:hypothetical protein